MMTAARRSVVWHSQDTALETLLSALHRLKFQKLHLSGQCGGLVGVLQKGSLNKHPGDPSLYFRRCVVPKGEQSFHLLNTVVVNS